MTSEKGTPPPEHCRHSEVDPGLVERMAALEQEMAQLKLGLKLAAVAFDHGAQ